MNAIDRRKGGISNQVASSRIPPATLILFHLIDKIFTTIWLLIRAALWAWVVYIVYLSIKELAGQQTAAHFILEFFTSSEKTGSFGTVVWVVVSTLLFGWAKIERWLRLSKVSHMSGRINELEKHYDQNRTSSGLTATGETPEDERMP